MSGRAAAGSIQSLVVYSSRAPSAYKQTDTPGRRVVWSRLLSSKCARGAAIIEEADAGTHTGRPPGRSIARPPVNCHHRRCHRRRRRRSTERPCSMPSRRKEWVLRWLHAVRVLPARDRTFALLRTSAPWLGLAVETLGLASDRLCQPRDLIHTA